MGRRKKIKPEASHKNKVKLARKHLTREEIKNKIPIFQSRWWEERQARIQREVIEREANQKEASRLRKEGLLSQPKEGK